MTGTAFVGALDAFTVVVDVKTICASGASTDVGVGAADTVVISSRTFKTLLVLENVFQSTACTGLFLITGQIRNTLRPIQLTSKMATLALTSIRLTACKARIIAFLNTFGLINVKS